MMLTAILLTICPYITEINKEDLYLKKVTATAYTNSVAETDSTPNITSTGKRVKLGYIAASRDIVKEIGYGSYIYVLESKEVFKLEDTMSHKKKNSVDIFMSKRKHAMDFGRQKITIVKLNEKIGRFLYEKGSK